jgi:hypothetical protein
MYRYRLEYCSEVQIESQLHEELDCMNSNNNYYNAENYENG